MGGLLEERRFADSNYFTIFWRSFLLRKETQLESLKMKISSGKLKQKSFKKFLISNIFIFLTKSPRKFSTGT